MSVEPEVPANTDGGNTAMATTDELKIVKMLKHLRVLLFLPKAIGELSAKRMDPRK